jgi:hypothetical protein
VDGTVAVVGLGIDAMDAVLLEQPCHHAANRLARQTAALARSREGDADLGGLRLLRRDAHGAVAVEGSTDPVDDGQLHPRPGIAEGDTFLRGDEPCGLSRRVGGVPRLVPRDVRVAAVGGEGPHVVELKRPKHQSLSGDVDHGTILPTLRLLEGS